MTSANNDELIAPEPEHCPGSQSESAGQASACAGCPNQSICSTSTDEKTRQMEQDRVDMSRIRDRTAGIKHVFAVLSGKGGVGKSTVCSQLAFALASGIDTQDEEANQDVKSALDGGHVGVLDADICGPSMPTVLGMQNEIIHASADGWEPATVFDDGDTSLNMVSVGMMLENKDEAVIWRGNKKHGLIKQFLRDVSWGPLDYLLLDTPPGTSDEHLSIVQCLKEALITDQKAASGAILVTTPQEMSLQDVRKEIAFCRKVGLRILGVIENMHGFVCPSCQGESDIFPVASESPAKKMCERMDIAYLGSLPLDPRVGQLCDKNVDGVGFVDAYPDAKWTLQFKHVLKNLAKQLTS